MGTMIIHETDYHGCGNLYYDGVIYSYSYDDDGLGNVKATVEELINIGFISPGDVRIYKGNELYHEFAKLLEEHG